MQAIWRLSVLAIVTVERTGERTGELSQIKKTTTTHNEDSLQSAHYGSRQFYLCLINLVRIVSHGYDWDL